MYIILEMWTSHHCSQYDLRVVFIHDGIFGRKHLYSYVQDKGKWWKTVDNAVTEVIGERTFFVVFMQLIITYHRCLRKPCSQIGLDCISQRGHIYCYTVKRCPQNTLRTSNVYRGQEVSR
jgi:hypothetical protein